MRIDAKRQDAGLLVISNMATAHVEEVRRTSEHCSLLSRLNFHSMVPIGFEERLLRAKSIAAQLSGSIGSTTET